MATDRPDPQHASDSGQVLHFRLRPSAAPRPLRDRLDEPADEESEPLDDLAQYEQQDEVVDYRHRMLMNILAVAIVALLVGCSVWIADTIAIMQKNQDCVLQGRSNCAPIEFSAPNAY